MTKHRQKDVRRKEHNYLRGYNELYDNLPSDETFIDGKALIHMVMKDQAGADIIDEYWINLIVDEVHKLKFYEFIRKVNKAKQREIRSIVDSKEPPIDLIRLYFKEFEKLAEGRRFYIGNPFNYLTNVKDE
jgi:hypothetical protein